MTTTRELFRARVRRTALRLDRDRAGWHWKISTNRLDMADCTRCMLGQLAAKAGQPVDRSWLGWQDLLSWAGITNKQAETMGYNTLDDDIEYETLTELWLKEIRKRRTR